MIAGLYQLYLNKLKNNTIPEEMTWEEFKQKRMIEPKRAKQKRHKRAASEKKRSLLYYLKETPPSKSATDSAGELLGHMRS